MSGSPPSSGSHGEFPPSSGSHGESSTRTSGPSSGNNTGSLDPKPNRSSRQQGMNETFRIESSSGQNLPESGSSVMSMMKKEKSSEFTNPDMYHNVFQNTTDGSSAKDPFKDKMENQKVLKALNLPQQFTLFLCKSVKGKEYIKELLKRTYNLKLKSCIFTGSTLKVMVEENVDVEEFCQKICMNLFIIPPEDPLCEIFKSDIGRKVFKDLREKHGKLEMFAETAPYCVGTSDIELDVKESISQSLLTFTKSEQIIVPSKDAWQFCKQHMKCNLEGKGIRMKHQQNSESCDPWVIEIDGPFHDVSSLKSKLISDLDKIETKVVRLDPEVANCQQFQDPSFLKKLCENQRCLVEFKTTEVGQRKPWKKWIKKDKEQHKFTYEVSYEKFPPAADEVHILLCLEEQEKGGARRKTYNDKFFYPLDEPSRFRSYVIYVPISSDGKKKDRFSQCLKALFLSEEVMNIEKLVVSCHLLSEKEIVYCTKIICHEIDHIQSVSAANVNFRECRFYEERPEMFPVLIDIFDNYLQEDIEVLQWRGRAIDVQVRKGQLACLEDCDVLVNSTSTNLVLGEGAVSKSLVKVAGDEIKKECKENYKKGIKPGEIAITKGYKLKCKLVFHGAINKFSVEEKCKSLKDLLRTCLRTADEMKMHSIAFPAIGTGNLGYHRNEVAKIMFDVVEEYKQRIPNGSLQRVCFVIFEEDIDSLREFQSLEKKYWKEKTTENPKLLVTADDSDVLQKVCKRIMDAFTPAAVCEPPRNEISQKERLGLSSKEKIQSDSSSEVKTTKLHHRHSEQSSDCSTSDLTKKEKCCLLVQRNLQGSIRSTDTKLRKEDLEKDFYEYRLKNVVCPFDGERQALLQFLTPQDCDRCTIDASLTRLYVFYSFPEQAVNDLKAVLHSKMTKFLRDNNISAEDVKQHSGVEVDHSHGSSMVLKGNIMEIKAAYEYLSALLAASKKQLEPCQSGTMKQNSLMERSSEDSLTTTIKKTPGGKSSSAQEFPRIHQTPDGGASVPDKPFGQSLNPQGQPVILSKSQSLLNPNMSMLKSLKSIDCDIGTKKSAIPSKKTKTCTSDEYVMLKHFHQHVLADCTETWNRHKTSVELTFTDEDIVVKVDDMFKDMLKLERDHISYPSTCDAVEKYVESKSGDDILCIRTQFDGESCIAVIGKERSTVQQVCIDLKQILNPQRSSFKGRTRSGISKSGSESLHKERKPIFTTNEGIEVFIYKESILKANADAVVCPVSKNFDIQSGLPKVIAEKAGWDFKIDCEKLLHEKGSVLPVGFAHAMNPGNLKEFKAVINVVSCQWSKYKQDECKHNLTAMLMHVLYVAEAQKLNSVALPAICSGRAGFPKNICAELYASCVVEYSQNAGNSESTIKEVHFVDTDDEMFVVMESVFANPNAFQDFVIQKSKILPSKSCTPEILIYKEKEGKYMINQNIVIYLYNTEATEVKSDALVCTTDESLEEAPIMKVLEKAGKKFKETFKKFGKQYPSEIGLVKVTDPPHHMTSSYKHIMYTNTPKWSTSQKSNLTEEYFKDLALMYSRIFETAVKEKINSIAMPVYGPLKDHQWLVKKSIMCLLDEVVKFSLKKWDGSKLFAVSIANKKPDVHSLILEGLQDLIDRGPNGFQHLTKQPNLYGDQPWGAISETEEMQGLGGYLSHRTIVLSITFPDVVQTKRSHPSFGVKVYLPKTPKGEKVAGLLKEAFERRILFTLKSHKNEQFITYTDIPLKTSKHGKYGYPDEKYLNNVLEILKRKLGQ